MLMWRCTSGCVRVFLTFLGTSVVAVMLSVKFQRLTKHRCVECEFMVFNLVVECSLLNGKKII